MIREWFIRFPISPSLQRLLAGSGIGKEQAEDFVHEDICAAVRNNIGMLPQGWQSIPWPAMVVRQYVVASDGEHHRILDLSEYEAASPDIRERWRVMEHGRYIALPIHVPKEEPEAEEPLGADWKEGSWSRP